MNTTLYAKVVFFICTYTLSIVDRYNKYSLFFSQQLKLRYEIVILLSKISEFISLCSFIDLLEELFACLKRTCVFI